MKYVSALLLLLFTHLANASDCKINNGPWIFMPNTHILDAKVTVRTTPGSQRILLDGYTLECMYSWDETGPVTFKDFWHTTMTGVTPGPKLATHRIGLNINNVDYNAPVPSGIHIATMLNNRVFVDLRTYMYVINSGSPTNPINIRTNDLLGVIHLRQTNNTGSPPVNHVQIRLIAGNDLIIEPSTCAINGNRPIDVNFSNVDGTRLTDNVNTTPARANIRLNYSCPNPGITMPIKITLKGTAASFNSRVLRMSNTNLGAGLIRGGALVGPEQSFNTNIYNSSGGDDVTFALIRKAGSTPATGPFTGSGTLIMGLP